MLVVEELAGYSLRNPGGMRVPFEPGLKGGVSDFLNRTVHSINGGADEAIAEGRRQEALAGMGEAGEQYVRFADSNMLMRWAVER